MDERMCMVKMWLLDQLDELQLITIVYVFFCMIHSFLFCLDHFSKELCKLQFTTKMI